MTATNPEETSSETVSPVSDEMRQEQERIENIVRQTGGIDTGILETSLALSALAALLASSDNNIIVRVFGVSGFVLAALAAGMLYYSYVVEKVPTTFDKLGEKVGLGSFRAVFWLFKRWAKLMKKSAFGPISLRESTELGYLNVLAAFAIVWTGLAFWVFFSFSP